MQNVFLVFGYGVPEDILKDENSNIYLKAAFNRIFDLSVNRHGGDPLVIASGGKTDMRRPYTRTEAGEILRFFKALCQKPHLKEPTRGWKFLAEAKAISSLENLLGCLRLLKARRIARAKVYVFCEQTRGRRIQKMAKRILAGYRVRVLPIDFDVSLNRYLDPEVLEKKEQLELKHMQWALQSPANLKQHHAFFAERLRFLRARGPKNHPQAVKEWMEKKMRNISV